MGIVELNLYRSLTHLLLTNIFSMVAAIDLILLEAVLSVSFLIAFLVLFCLLIFLYFGSI